ncbi:MAG: hypothetical protein U5L76_04985 [Patescibacteria group bacterium]|nr:hypothetical protein [Patescibacteria group bacterium]
MSLVTLNIRVPSEQADNVKELIEELEKIWYRSGTFDGQKVAVLIRRIREDSQKDKIYIMSDE